jgi:hypothetical protein
MDGAVAGGRPVDRNGGELTGVRDQIANEMAQLEGKLAVLDRERAAIREQVTDLRRRLAESAAMPIAVPSLPPSPAPVPTTQTDKVALFASLFRGRLDVYPRFWSNEKSGKKGYSPRCLNEWDRPRCQKPRVKCGDCPHQAFEPVTQQVLLDHLQGRHIIGVYPLLADERCHLLAIDFDEGAWAEDVVAFAETCRAIGLPAVLERSRSGDGAHAWFFFQGPVHAAVARRSVRAARCSDGDSISFLPQHLRLSVVARLSDAHRSLVRHRRSVRHPLVHRLRSDRHLRSANHQRGGDRP